MCDNYRGCICRSQLNVEGVEGAGHHLVPEVLHLHTAMGSYSTRVYKSWARNNTTATTCQCFQATKMGSVILYLL